MKIEFIQLTSPGDRDVNQDFMVNIIEKRYALFVVADGLGGHHAGEKASHYFCEGMLGQAYNYARFIPEDPAEVFLAWINAAINEMKLMFAGDPLAVSAHTTCAILYLDDELTMTAHCGDSRVYRIRPNEILWRTRDHSIPQDLLDMGMITEQELAHHPDQNQLTRSINVENAHPIDIQVHDAMTAEDIFILCSDGFWEHVKQNELMQLADCDEVRAYLTKLLRMSVYRAMGKSDNVTVQLVRRPKS
ncbi:PPM family protein phosphatase [biofilm metagenome]